MLTLLSGAWWLASATSLYGKARSAAAGPFGGALGATIAALVLVGGAALGLAWLRHDAAGDASSAAVARCDAREHLVALAGARAEAEALRRAAAQKDAEIEMRRVQQELAEEELSRIERDMEKARAESAKGGGGRGIAIPDDGWLRQGAGARAAGGAAGRR